MIAMEKMSIEQIDEIVQFYWDFAENFCKTHSQQELFEFISPYIDKGNPFWLSRIDEFLPEILGSSCISVGS